MINAIFKLIYILYVCICIYIYVYLYIYVYIHMYLNMPLNTYIYINISLFFICIHALTHKNMHTFKNIQILDDMIEAERKNAIFSNLNEFEEREVSCLYSGMCTYICTYIYEYICIYICIYVYTYMYI
jgi:hypothetical protein